MEVLNRIGELASRAMNNNTVINVFLGSSFVALTLRSKYQQNSIERLEAEKESLTKDNKAVKRTIWDWKQQLFAEATDAADSAVVPLSKLKAIYGEAVSVQSGDAVKNDVKSTEKFVI